MENLRHVKDGQPWVPNPDTHNAFVDAAQYVRQLQQSGGDAPGRRVREHSEILVRNDSGVDREWYDVLGIDDSLIDPATHPAEFKNHILLSGVTPDEDAHRGKFCILLEPAPAGKIRPAIVAGVTVAKVNVVSTAHQYADVKDGDAACLQTCAAGGARILWRAGSVGVVWGVVRIEGAAGEDQTRFFELKTNLLPGGSATAYLRTKSAVTGLLETDVSVEFVVKDDIGDRYGTGRDGAGSGGHGAYGKAQLKWGDWWVYDLECP